MNEYSLKIAVGRKDGLPVTEKDFVSIADAFFDLEGIDDQDLSADAGTLLFTLTVAAADEVQALSAATVAVRTAIHAAGGGTAGWDDNSSTLRTVIEPSLAVA